MLKLDFKTSEKKNDPKKKTQILLECRITIIEINLEPRDLVPLVKQIFLQPRRNRKKKTFIISSMTTLFRPLTEALHIKFIICGVQVEKPPSRR